MSDLQNKSNPNRKATLNLFFFLLSIIIITTILPRDEDYNLLNILGSSVIVSSSYLILYLFLSHFRSEILLVVRKTLFILVTILFFSIVTHFVSVYKPNTFLYVIPFAIIPVIIRTFYDARLALFILLITLMITGFMVPDHFDFVFLNFVVGMVAIFTLSNLYRKGKLFYTALLVFISYSVIYTTISLSRNGNFEGIVSADFILFAINGLLILLSYPFIFLFEDKFLFLSDSTLLELADINQPLLRKLAEEAPGSFQHSLQVANLAEEAARVVGGNPLLVRAGALYHDIGKISNPGYFTENQANGRNPHDEIDSIESVNIILSHIGKGVELARKFKLPVQIIDFIRTHHGTTVAYYFYKKYLNEHPSDTGMRKEFSYPGPKPFSKELAVVMMADAVEASSRSLVNYTEENLSELVERIMLLQEQDGQYSDAPLTFRDISEIKKVFRKRLSNIHHVRVAYP